MNTTHFTRFAKIATGPVGQGVDMILCKSLTVGMHSLTLQPWVRSIGLLCQTPDTMNMLNGQYFDFRIFMRRRGWNSVFSIMLMIALVIVIILKT